MISPQLLSATLGRAPGISVYGGPGLLKTNAIHTLPPPILSLDIGEGGFVSIAPWIRRVMNASDRQWSVYLQAERQQYFDLLNEKTKANVRLKPAPYVDVIHFDNTEYEEYNRLTECVANFDVTKYNSLAIDSLHEFAQAGATFSRGPGQFMSLMNETKGGFAWARAQELSGQRLRKIRNYRDSGVFIYLVGAEDVAKDYVNTPFEKRPQGSQPPEAYSIRGTVDLPGRLASALSHIPDVLAHARLIGGKVLWVTEPEMLQGGGASWDAKDRFGRLDKYEQPNFRTICEKLYGKEGRDAIYNYGKAMASVVDTDPADGE